MSDRGNDGPDEPGTPDKTEGHDAVVTPDEVTGPDEEPTGAEPTRRSRRPLWAMIAGLSAVWFAVFGPFFVLILAPVAIFLGRRVLAQDVSGPDDVRVRRQGRVGLFGGIIAAALLLLQIVLIQLFFVWEKEGLEPGERPAPTAPADDGGGES